MRIKALAAAAAAAGALAAAVFAAAPVQAGTTPVTYDALGDSYSSGVGAGDYLADDGCYRSEHAYPKQVTTLLLEPLKFDACSGATTADVTANQLHNLSAGTGHVTISVGGNDIGFSSVLGACAGTDASQCTAAIDGARAKIADDLPAKLDALYTEIHNRAPYADVIVVGYPHLFNGTTCATTLAITPDEMAAINDTADQLAAVISAAASAHGFTFADPRSAFAGHEVCTADPYLLGYQASATVESFHPTVAGQNAYAALVGSLV